MVSNPVPSFDVMMQLEFGAVPRLEVLADRVITLGPTDFDVTETIITYYKLADWLMAERWRTASGLKLEVFG